MRYQDHLYAQGKLEGYEKKMYLRRQRQALLWQLLLNDTIESLPAYGRDPQGELTRAVAEATGVKADFAAEEVARVLALGALVPQPEAGGTRYAWSE